jgi:hypothetical protein
MGAATPFFKRSNDVELLATNSTDGGRRSALSPPVQAMGIGYKKPTFANAGVGESIHKLRYQHEITSSAFS